MSSLLLAESGSTKTDWCLIRKGKKPVEFRTTGINPLLQSTEEIMSVLHNELHWNPKIHAAEKISFYGSGAGSAQRQKEIAAVLKKFFGSGAVEVQSDMMAAARALCGDQKGIVCILGTGSNSCFYNGKTIKEQQASLGYIAGDEGSGNHLGKRVLQYYAYKTFDLELTLAFEKLFGNDLPEILRKLYREPFPNRYLAQFVQLLVENRGHYMVENILEDCLNDFFHNHILKYRQSWKSPIHFTGSIAYLFQDIILDISHQYELELGKIEKSPIQGLMNYHKSSL
ncbi:N-acetylglucosamine kinase [Taibaiella soli]|uniref:N-acetylglucosamine kinase n=1 Tax=Taibaiella soli TaxID=1649169 RepID=A0A2W2B3W3_9BACT|nr:N-acetylglucosamine kinase [Taibaiella soli]PZF75014.1 N-acetylglucosamine kinase [Taibaiella soli]